MPSIDRSDIGRRVVVRYRLAKLHDGARATDVLGLLDGWEGGVLRVRTRAGVVVDIREDDVLAAKVIPARTLARRDVRDLEAAAALGWQALDTAQLGGWLLRYAGGFTNRANSCLPLADPGLPLAKAVDEVERWYHERGVAAAFQVPGRLGAGLDAELDGRGYLPPPEEVVVMTAPVAAVITGERDDLPPVIVKRAPNQAWLAGYHYRGGTLPAHARQVLVNAECAGFASVDEGGRRVAIARGAVSDAPTGRRWVGITAVEVAESARRRGLGTHVVAGVGRWAATHGATDAYLQVSEGNVAALAAYQRLGFTEHHRYHYRRTR